MADAEINGLITAIIAAANAQAAAANAQAAAQPPPPPAPPVQANVQNPFALLPGAADTGALDFTKSEAIKLFNKAITPLDPKYNLSEGKLRIFLEQVRERGRIYCWDDILTVEDSDGVGQNIITHYGKLSVDNCIAHAMTYVNTETRRAQDAMMLFQLLINSLAEESKLLMLADADVYTVAGKPDGVVFLKLIIGRASIDTNAKIHMLRQKIANLKTAMRDEFKGNVREFNVHVANLRDQLLGRGQKADELVTHLFDAYLQSVPNEEFKRYVEMHRNLYDDGMMLTAEQLMRYAITKYDTINQRIEVGQEQEPPVMALQTAVEEKRPRDGGDATSTLKALLTKLTEGNRGKRTNRKIPGWKKQAPTGSEPKTKAVNGKQYHWCIKHKMWTIHTATECTLPDEQGQKGEGNQPDQSLKLSRALLSMMNDEESE
jgi:hypothetical protein